MTHNNDQEYYEGLVVKAVDGQLSDAEKVELDAYLEEHPEMREELADFNLIKETTDAIVGRIMADADIEPPRETPAAKALIGGSYLLLLAGALLLIGFSVFTFLTDSGVPPIIKVGTSIGGIGALLLFGHYFRLRMRAVGNDPYREIDR